jgi:N-acetylglucosaminyldiphosphoundecaprenol N-acetyl-beta-D-mannosaminyltransferase
VTPSSLAPSSSVPCVDVLSIPFHSLHMGEVLDVLESFIAQRTPPRQICMANALTVALAWRDPELTAVLRQSDLVLADGMSIVWGARWIGVHLPERIAGPDLMVDLCQRAAERGYRIYLCGSSPENVQNLQARLLERWPRLQIVGVHSPPMRACLGEEDSRIILDELGRTRPDILFLGMSMPKQEKWIARHRAQLSVPVSIGVGAAFDFLSGQIPRAPLRLQKIGLEWLYRLYCEPRRLWKRYLLGNAIFLLLLLKEMAKRKIHFGTH